MKATEYPDLLRHFGLRSMLLLCVLLTAGTTPRNDLTSLGKQDPNDSSATVRFDYFRVYRS
jgi:hypothetical protein